MTQKAVMTGQKISWLNGGQTGKFGRPSERARGVAKRRENQGQNMKGAVGYAATTVLHDNYYQRLILFVRQKGRLFV